MEKEGVKDLGRYLFIPIEHCVRGSQDCTDVFIFKPEDIKKVDVHVPKGADLEKYMYGLRGLLDPRSIASRPLVSLTPSKNKERVQLNILTEGYWGTYSDGTVFGKKEEYVKVWPTRAPELSGRYRYKKKRTSTLILHVQKNDGSLAHTYFPTDIKSIDELQSRLFD